MHEEFYEDVERLKKLKAYLIPKQVEDYQYYLESLNLAMTRYLSSKQALDALQTEFAELYESIRKEQIESLGLELKKRCDCGCCHE